MCPSSPSQRGQVGVEAGMSDSLQPPGRTDSQPCCCPLCGGQLRWGDLRGWLRRVQSKCSLGYNEGPWIPPSPVCFIRLHFVLGAQLWIILAPCQKCAGFSVPLCCRRNCCLSAFPTANPGLLPLFHFELSKVRGVLIDYFLIS